MYCLCTERSILNIGIGWSNTLGGALALPDADINEFLRGQAIIQTWGG